MRRPAASHCAAALRITSSVSSKAPTATTRRAALPLERIWKTDTRPPTLNRPFRPALRAPPLPILFSFGAAGCYTVNVAQAMPKASRRPSGGRTDAFCLRELNNERTSASYEPHQTRGLALLVSYSASPACELALFSAREVSAARLSMRSSRTRLAK